MNTGTKVGYARTSREDQCLDLQLNALRREGVIDKHLFQEQISASAKKRKQYDLALKRCRKGDILVVWKLDRLGRSLKQLTDTVADLEARGVQVVSITERIDTTTPLGKLFFHFMASIAQFEADLISERTKAGQAAGRERGTYRTRPVSFTEVQWNTMLKNFEKDDTQGISAIARSAGLKYATVCRYWQEIKGAMSFHERFPYEKGHNK